MAEVSRVGSEMQARGCPADIFDKVVIAACDQNLQEFQRAVHHLNQCETCRWEVDTGALETYVYAACPEEFQNALTHLVSKQRLTETENCLGMVLLRCDKDDVYSSSPELDFVMKFLGNHEKPFPINAALHLLTKHKRNKSAVDGFLKHAGKCSQCRGDLDWGRAYERLRAKGKEWSAELLTAVRNEENEKKRKAPDECAPEAILSIDDNGQKMEVNVQLSSSLDKFTAHLLNLGYPSGFKHGERVVRVCFDKRRRLCGKKEMSFVQVNSEEIYGDVKARAKYQHELVKLTALATVPVYVPGIEKPVPVPMGTSLWEFLDYVVQALRLNTNHLDLRDLLRLRVNNQEVRFFVVGKKKSVKFWGFQVYPFSEEWYKQLKPTDKLEFRTTDFYSAVTQRHYAALKSLGLRCTFDPVLEGTILGIKLQNIPIPDEWDKTYRKRQFFDISCQPPEVPDVFKVKVDSDDLKQLYLQWLLYSFKVHWNR